MFYPDPISQNQRFCLPLANDYVIYSRIKPKPGSRAKSKGGDGEAEDLIESDNSSDFSDGDPRYLYGDQLT